MFMVHTHNIKTLTMTTMTMHCIGVRVHISSLPWCLTVGSVLYSMLHRLPCCLLLSFTCKIHFNSNRIFYVDLIISKFDFSSKKCFIFKTKIYIAIFTLLTIKWHQFWESMSCIQCGFITIIFFLFYLFDSFILMAHYNVVYLYEDSRRQQRL